MGEKLDQAKGRIKEAAGVLRGDNRLKREGKRDQVVGKVKVLGRDVGADLLTGDRERRTAADKLQRLGGRCRGGSCIRGGWRLYAS
jgi:hypothetical protein